MENGSTTITGIVDVRGDGRQIQARSITHDRAKDIATAEGPVSIREHGLFIKGERAQGNLFAGTGVMDNASFLLHQSHLRGSAATITRTEDGVLDIETGMFTRCDPGSDLWKLRGRNIQLHAEDGYGIARDVSVVIRGVPIAYFPYLRFPLTDDRQSGFLMPGAGVDSDGGTEITVPYYFNLAPGYDATYTLHSLWKRGIVHEGELRYLNTFSRNLLNAAFLHGDDIYDGRNTIDVSASGSPLPADEADRWLLYLNHTGGWASRWKSQVSYGAVSDVDYLHDIGGRVDLAAQQAASDTQGLASATIPALHRTGSIQYRGDDWSFQVRARGYQSLEQHATPQYESLPQVTIRTARSRHNLDLDLLMQYTRFDKDTEDTVGALAITGDRLVVDASVSASLHNGWGYLVPSVGVIHRSYRLSQTPEAVRNHPTVTTPVFSLDSGIVWERFFSYRQIPLQQTLAPRLYFLYVKREDQADLPQFDASSSTPGYSQMFRRNRFTGYDRIGDARQLSIGLTSSVFSADSGAEYLTASIGQIVYFRDREVVFRQGRSYVPDVGSSALFAETRVRLGQRLSARGSYEWDPHRSRSNRGKLSLRYRGANDRSIINLNYSYSNPDVQAVDRFQNTEESDVSFVLPIRGKWSVIGRWNFGWDNDQTIESLFGVEYNNCCWTSRLAYRRYLEAPRTIRLINDDPASPGNVSVVSVTDHRADSGLYFEFQLKGLSTLGRSFSSLLGESIPGYRQREERIGPPH